MTKPRASIRKATIGDLVPLFNQGYVGPSTNAVVGEADGQKLGVGGLAYSGGRVWAFCDLTPQAREYPVLLHRMGLAFMERARKNGHKYVYAMRDLNAPTADCWLRRLGFIPLTDELNEQAVIYRWQP